MASLIEELTANLREEGGVYKELLLIAEKKMRIIVKNDLDELRQITDDENGKLDHIAVLEAKRVEVVNNIGVVLNRNPEKLSLSAIISLLDRQPEEQKELKRIHDDLKATAGRLQELNRQNKQLIEESLEMIEFNMNFIQSTRMSSGSSNYTKGASVSDADASQSGMFDAKQ